MKWIELLTAILVGLATSFTLIPLLIQASRRQAFVGRNHEPHHTHTVPVSRLGGVALAVAMVVVALIFSCLSGLDFFQKNERYLVVPGSVAMFGLGLWDDLFVLGARRKLLGQLLIASALYFGGIGIAHFRIPFTWQIIDLGLWAWPITVFWLVAMTNLINLIDGVDGLAGGISLMLMVLLVYVSLQNGLVPIVAAGVAGALLGFLRFNFPPARIYMGDGGAYFLGCFIGCSTIVCSQKGTLFAALVAPLFVLALPIIDTSLAILRRGIRGLPLFRPDRKHIHHRLLASGHSRRNVVLGLYGFTAFFLALGFAIFYLHGQYFPLFLGAGSLVIILASRKFNFSREWYSVGRVLGNSLEARAEVQYAMSLLRWLALEGDRAQTPGQLAEDVVFIARKLGFAHVRIRLENEEKVWPLTGSEVENGFCFRHGLPGHANCFLEVGVAKASAGAGVPIKCEATCEILADLLAEGWAKAIADWKKRRQLPVRFDAGRSAPSTGIAAAPRINLPDAEIPPLAE